MCGAPGISCCFAGEKPEVGPVVDPSKAGPKMVCVKTGTFVVVVMVPPLLGRFIVLVTVWLPVWV